MPVKLPKVGKRYRYTDVKDMPIGITVDTKDNSFLCTQMSKSGALYSNEVLWSGKEGSWCVATQLDRPLIELVKEYK
jgi:hypothetical protein